MIISRGKITSYDFSWDHRMNELRLTVECPLRLVGGPSKTRLRDVEVTLELSDEDGAKILRHVADGKEISVGISFDDTPT